ncbi:hypothetical protein ACLKA7_004467 [Drosophila subpalustris]
MKTRLMITRILLCIFLLKGCIASNPNCDQAIDSCKAKMRRFYELWDEVYLKCFSENGKPIQETCNKSADDLSEQKNNFDINCELKLDTCTTTTRRFFEIRNELHSDASVTGGLNIPNYKSFNNKVRKN